MIEDPDWNDARKDLLSSTRHMLETERAKALRDRNFFFQPSHDSPSAYAASLEAYRETLVQLLGWPLTEPLSEPGADCQFLRDDELGRIYRVIFRVTKAQRGFGLFFLPRLAGHHPAVITLHGGGGSPELAAGLLECGPTNYREMIRGLRRRNVAVFAPQLLIWGGGQTPNFDQFQMDREFRHLGGSRAAWDLRQLQAAFEWLCRYPEIDAQRVGVAGLSYGGFYALYFGALEQRLRGVVCSCFLNDRHRYAWEDWVWTGAARLFLDSEVARMICPRRAFFEAGAADELFEPIGFIQTAEEVKAAYEKLGLPELCHTRVHAGSHEYDPDGRAETFLCSTLEVPEDPRKSLPE